MKRFFTTLLLFLCVAPFVSAASAINTLTVHPGETVYARFEVSARKIRLIQVSKTPDAEAQVIFSLAKDATLPVLNFKVENKFPYELVYRAEMRSLSTKQHYPVQVTPVVRGKNAYEKFPIQVEEIAAFDFKLEK
jgi:hypothetical protein